MGQRPPKKNRASKRKDRELTPAEEANLERSVNGWLSECQRWAKEMESMKEVPSDDDIVSAAIKATYFVMSARCAYLHCKSFLEARLKNSAEAKREFKNRTPKGSCLDKVLDLGDWLNHGAIYRRDNFNPTFCMMRKMDKTLEEAFNLAASSRKSVIIGMKSCPSWMHGEEFITEDIRSWQKDVILELEGLFQDIKQISFVEKGEP